MLYAALRKLLFLLPAEFSHTVTLRGLNYIYKSRNLAWLRRKIFHKNTKHKTSSIKCMGLEFPNRVGLAAGLDKNAEYIDALSALGFGFIEVGTLTPRPQLGNTKPRLFRLPGSKAIINRMGFNNVGIDQAIENIKAAKYKGILGINIGKNYDTPIANAHQDYLDCFNKAYPYASYITINISSPNTKNLRTLQQSDSLDLLLGKLKQQQLKLSKTHKTKVPLVVKIAPDLTDKEISGIAQILLRHKIDGVIATNTSITRDTLIPGEKHINEAGGLSGQPVQNMSNKVIKKLHQELQNKIPIIGVGGILDNSSAKAKLHNGAQLIQLYTGFIYEGPALVRKLIKNL
ncbi:MAG: dihydroorotate dehydrogenase (quinone) [Legionellales bacterium]|nr:MAG: dihydroorotate dehydrogenase (quinone) [Legionellales bacterium]